MVTYWASEYMVSRFVLSSLYYTTFGFLLRTSKFWLFLLLKVGMHSTDSVKPLEAQANKRLKKVYSRHRLYLLGIANSVMPQKKYQWIWISNGDIWDRLKQRCSQTSCFVLFQIQNHCVSKKIKLNVFSNL